MVLGILNFIIGWERGAERAENRVERWAGVAENDASGSVSGGRGGGAETEGVIEVGLNTERVFLPLTLRSRSAHMLCH